MFNRFNVACALTPSTYWSIAVAKINLSRMDFASLITLRKQVENALSERRTTLEKQLAALGGLSLRLVVRLPALREAAG